MSANNFFEQHSLEEISKKTKISPISLRFIKNKEYEKIPRVKFLGFIKIIEREYKIDLSHLIEEYDLANNIPHTNSPKEELANIPEINTNNKSYLVIILATILLIIVGYLLWNYTKKEPENIAISHIEINETNKTNAKNTTKNNITNIQTTDENISNKTQNTQSQNIAANNEFNNTKQTSTHDKTLTNKTKAKLNTPTITKQSQYTTPKKEKTTTTYPVTIIPKQKVWFRAINLDTNKTISTLTSRIKTLPKGNYYIKFGHGLVEIKYNDQTISPNTKQIVRIELKNGEYKILQNPPKGYPR